MKFIKIVPFVLIGSLLMSSCSISKEVKIEIETNLTNETKVITPEEVSISETYSSIEKNLFLNTQFLPSTGDVNILVIPTIIPGYELVDYNEDGIDDKEQVKQDIQTAFFGGNNLLNESVSSFYKKSSFNQLNINGYVTDWFSIENDSNLNITNGAQIEVDYTYEVVDAAVEWAKNVQGIDLTQYDSDHDGYVDGVWLIYSAHNYYQGGPQTNTNNYFAYTSWGNTTDDGETVPSVTNPIYSVFGWASWDFMYDGTSKSKIRELI